jgi:hypothetical protein
LVAQAGIGRRAARVDKNSTSSSLSRRFRRDNPSCGPPAPVRWTARKNFDVHLSSHARANERRWNERLPCAHRIPSPCKLIFYHDGLRAASYRPGEARERAGEARRAFWPPEVLERLESRCGQHHGPSMEPRGGDRTPAAAGDGGLPTGGLIPHTRDVANDAASAAGEPEMAR